MSSLKEQAFNTVRERATRSGRAPRRAYQHYFIETEGLHSRIHLQNFWSTFWPVPEATATAHVRVFAADGTQLGELDRELPAFGSAFIEMRDLLADIGAQAPEGTVAIDLEPSAAIRARFGVIPRPEEVEVRTPFWMAYYDDADNYMYVHSIEMLAGEFYGVPSAIAWQLKRGQAAHRGGTWRSWRLLESTGLRELQVVVTNHTLEAGRTTVGLYTAEDQPVIERSLDFTPHQLHRVKFSAQEIQDAVATHAPGTLLRVGLDPLLSLNGKPYVLMRYDDGPLSLHHG